MPLIADAEHLVSMAAPSRSVTSTMSGLATRLSQQRHGHRWQEVIGQLFKWWNEPEYFAAEDFDPPAREILEIAMSIATAFRDAGYAPPDSVVPDANEGIVFQLRRGEQTEKIHVWGDGEIEYIRFSGTKIIDRQPIQRV